MEIKAVVVGGPRDGCAGDRSIATNPLAGFAAIAEPLTTAALAGGGAASGRHNAPRASWTSGLRLVWSG